MYLQNMLQLLTTQHFIFLFVIYVQVKDASEIIMSSVLQGSTFHHFLY